jgi:hypothetical protein
MGTERNDKSLKMENILKNETIASSWAPQRMTLKTHNKKRDGKPYIRGIMSVYMLEMIAFNTRGRAL